MLFNRNRRMVLRTLRDWTRLQHIQVDNEQFPIGFEKEMESYEELKQEVIHNLPISMNGALFGRGCKDDSQRNTEGKRFLKLLFLLCEKIAITANAHSQNDESMTAENLFHSILVRLSPSRSAAVAEAYAKPLVDLENDELVLSVPAYKKVAFMKPAPASIVLYETNGSVHAVVEHAHAYGMFRRADAITRPWISVTMKTHERVNLTSNQSIRSIDVCPLDEKLHAM